MLAASSVDSGLAVIRADGSHKALPTNADGLQSASAVLAQSDMVYVLSAAYITQEDPTSSSPTSTRPTAEPVPTLRCPLESQRQVQVSSVLHYRCRAHHRVDAHLPAKRSVRGRPPCDGGGALL